MTDAFVHEGITTGLKGGRLHLDDEDLETMQDSIDNRSLVMSSTTFRAAAKFATAPINLAVRQPAFPRSELSSRRSSLVA